MAAPETDALVYDPLESRLLTGEAVALDLHPTPWVLRAAGVIIDYVAYTLLGLGLLWLLIVALVNLQPEETVVSISFVVLVVVTYVVVPTAVETLSRGRSLGKLIVGGRIVRDDGGAIGLRHALIRSLIAVLEIVITVGGTAAVVGFLNERSKRVGDWLAGTYSQRERVSKRRPLVFGVPAQLASWAQIADVARLPDRLSRRIASFFAQSTGLTPVSRTRLAHDLAAEASAYVSPLPPVDAEVFLAGVLALRRERELTAWQLEDARLARLAPTLTALPTGFPDRG